MCELIQHRLLSLRGLLTRLQWLASQKHRGSRLCFRFAQPRLCGRLDVAPEAVGESLQSCASAPPLPRRPREQRRKRHDGVAGGQQPPGCAQRQARQVVRQIPAGGRVAPQRTADDINNAASQSGSGVQTLLWLGGGTSAIARLTTLLRGLVRSIHPQAPVVYQVVSDMLQLKPHVNDVLATTRP